jgi:CP family cyanate transporter-like MFS transporter
MDHSAYHGVAGKLVALTQGVGFVVAAIAPVFAGMVRSWTGGFGAAWVMVAVSIAAMIMVSLFFSPRSDAKWH